MNRNSIETYYRQVLPDIKKKHERVFEAIQKLGPSTVYEIADYLNTAVHNISGRLTELSGPSEYGRPIIEESGKRANKYGNPCTIWKIRLQPVTGEQQKMF